MSSSHYLIPKDPPSYESIYNTIPTHTSHSSTNNHKISHLFRRCVRRHSPFLQTFIAAIFVAATVSTTVMLLLWQLQNLATPQDPDHHGLNHDNKLTS
ncbi:hypothetical protein BDB01DRAFT_790546 [Pilobolus umbonatus]|nr:hypothetical protein BDB01DRAFT_790546 [Pilobolus umbonatus]